MGELLRRRAMMAAVSGDAPDVPLHPLKNGNYKGKNGNASDNVVTLGNHVAIYKRYGDASWYVSFPFETAFDLSVGDELQIEVDVTNITGGTLSVNLGTESVGGAIHVGSTTDVTTLSNTLTVTEPLTITRIYCTFNNTGTGKRAAFDVKIYVNGIWYC